MALEQYANAPIPSSPTTPWTTLSAGVDAVTTTLPVVGFAAFPSAVQYRLRIDDELLLVMGGAGTTSWTVTRGIEGSTAAVHASGAGVFHGLTKAGFLGNPLALTTSGDLPYLNASLNQARLPAPSDGDYLVRWTTAVPSWVSLATAGLLTVAAAAATYQPIGSYVTLTGLETLTNKTLTTPTIASFANATHTHLNAAGGGTLTAAAVSAPGSTTQIVFNNAGAYGASANLTWDGSILHVAGHLGSLAAPVTGQSYFGPPDSTLPAAVAPSWVFDGTQTVAITANNAADEGWALGIDAYSAWGIGLKVFNDFGNAVGIELNAYTGTTGAEGIAFYGAAGARGAIVAARLSTFYAIAPTLGDGATAASSVAFYADAQPVVGIAHAYPFWADEQGVFRIKADNTFNGVYQAIAALYNPQFTKYVAGAANYERGVNYWVDHVWTITTEEGGTGTLRGMQIGASTSVPIGFYGVTPVTQGASVADATDAASAITQLNALISRIEATGLIATV